MMRPTGKNAIYPYARLADDQGNPLPTPKDYRMAYTDTAGAGKLLNWEYYPLNEINYADNRFKQTDILLNLGAFYRYNKHVSFDVKYQYESQAGKTSNLYDVTTYLTRNFINRYSQVVGGQVQYGIPMGAILDLTDASLLSQAARVQANFNQQIIKGQELTVIAGGEVKQIQSGSNNSRTYGFNPDVLTSGNVDYVNNLPIYGNLSSATTINNPNGFSEGVLRFLSAFSNASYSIRGRYTFSASAREDASNLFGVKTNQKAVPLWSAGFSWQLNQENFYHSKALPVLKLRLTYGYNGNVDNTLSALTTIKYASRAPVTSLNYANTNNPPNPELQWEKTAVFTTGIDFVSRNHRFSGSIDYYRKKGVDLIGLSQVDPTTGVLDPSQSSFYFKGNVADMNGQGVDLNVTANILQGGFKWSAVLLFNYTESKVTKYNMSSTLASSFLGGGILINPILGKPLYTIYSYKWAGLDTLTGDPQGYLNGVVSKNYSSILNAPVDQLQYHGSALPVYYGSLRNTFSFKGFSLSVNIAYKLGYFFRRPSISYYALYNTWDGHADFSARWQKPGDEKYTNVPSMIYPNANSNRDALYTSSSVLIEKGDHIRLQDIAFSYDFAQQLLQHKSTFKNIQLYTYINNLGIIWKANKAGLDPDYFSNSGYPLPMTVSFGTKITF